MLTQDQIDAIPGQPDGIEDDSRDMPDPARAAERILTYVETFGDGLYSVASDGSPLYGRDLCSVAQAVKKLLAELDQLRGQYDTLLEDAERFRALARTTTDERDRLRAQAAAVDQPVSSSVASNQPAEDEEHGGEDHAAAESSSPVEATNG